MKVLTYIEQVKFVLLDKPKPEILSSRDAIIQGALGGICTGDLHIILILDKIAKGHFIKN